jgi:hypothetical protein
MAKQLVPDALWTIIEPLLPPEPLKPNRGRPRVPDRAVFAGIRLAGYAQGGVGAQGRGREPGGASALSGLIFVSACNVWVDPC